MSFGRTYRELFPLWKKALKPGAIEFFPVDERKVPINHPESNWGMAVRLLLNLSADKTSLENFVSSAEQYRELLLRKLGASSPIFDTVYLGIGDDGHTASLFPGQSYAPGETVFETESPNHPFPRVTLSPTILASARTVIFIVTDPHKKKILRRVLSLEAGLPAAEVLKTAAKVKVIVPGNLLEKIE